MDDVRLRPSQWTLLERFATIDERIEHNPGTGPIHVGLFNEGAFIIQPGVADNAIDEADFLAVEASGVLTVLSHTSTLVRFRVSQRGFDALQARKARVVESIPPARRRRYLVDPDESIAKEAAAWWVRGSELQKLGNAANAFEAYRRAWEIKLSRQPTGQRFHKGAELASMAAARVQGGMLREGFRWSLAAFLEDALSRAEDSPNLIDELHWPAAQTLRQFGVPENTLSELSAHARSRAAGAAIQDPMTIFREEGLDALVARVPVHVTPVAPTQVRVFVSSPGDLRRERRLVADVCRDMADILRRDIRALLWEGAGRGHPESPPFTAEVTGFGPQAVIDNQIRDAMGGYDIYVGMLWLRMGTPTSGWRSGTEAEFRYALREFQRVGRPRRLLFYTKRPRAGQVREPEAEAFVAELERDLGLPQRFGTTADLRRLLTHDLRQSIDEE
jgi:hypothetical protein